MTTSLANGPSWLHRRVETTTGAQLQAAPRTPIAYKTYRQNYHRVVNGAGGKR